MEIELKLALQPRHSSHMQHHPMLSKIAPQQRRLYSTYFDAPKFDLMQCGIALRVRQVDDQWIQTLKAETQSVGALTNRPEWEVSVTDGTHPDFSALPQEALDLLNGIKLKRIIPVFTTEFQRTTWQVINDQAHAEVALDRGKIHAGEANRPICEVEIELKSGTPEFLFDLAAQLLQQVPLHIEPRSKAERGYILCGAVKPAPVKSTHAPIDKHQTSADASNAILQAALVQFVANVPGFLQHAHETEYLHQLRVALRRLRTGVLLAKSLGRPLPDWDQELRELMHVLNPARDWDVFQEQILPKMLTRLSWPSENMSAENNVANLITNTATHARQRAQSWLRKPALTQLILDVGRSLLATPADRHEGDVKAWAGIILEKRWQQLHKRCHGFAKLNPAERHLARIAAKKMRYAAEAFLPLYGKHTEHFITVLATLQDKLGYENDLRIGIKLLRAIPKQSTALSFELGRICGALQLEAAQSAHLSATIWQEVDESKLFWR